MSVDYKGVTPKIIDYVADNMRQADRDEVYASHGYQPVDALIQSVKYSDFNSVACIAGRPVAIFGLMRRGLLSNKGIPWLLGTNEMFRYKREVVTASRVIVDSMIDICPELENYVHTKNIRSVRLLKYLGFKLDEPTPFGHQNELFNRFHMVKKDV